MLKLITMRTFAAAALTLGLTACGDDVVDDDGAGGGTTDAATTSSGTTTTADTMDPDGGTTLESDTSGTTTSDGVDTMAELECPEGESCVPVSGGGMACLAPSSHCVLLCNEGQTCPDNMQCLAGVCAYDVQSATNPVFPPEEDQDPQYPVTFPCPDGFYVQPLVPSPGTPALVCMPECGDMNSCPAPATGDANGACIANPTSSGTECG